MHPQEGDNAAHGWDHALHEGKNAVSAACHALHETFHSASVGDRAPHEAVHASSEGKHATHYGQRFMNDGLYMPQNAARPRHISVRSASRRLLSGEPCVHVARDNPYRVESRPNRGDGSHPCRTGVN